MVQNVSKAHIGASHLTCPYVLYIKQVYCCSFSFLFSFLSVALMNRKEVSIRILPVGVETYSNTYFLFNLLLLCRILYMFLKSGPRYLVEVRR